jgi:hypothetical protein
MTKKQLTDRLSGLATAAEVIFAEELPLSVRSGAAFAVADLLKYLADELRDVGQMLDAEGVKR